MTVLAVFDGRSLLPDAWARLGDGPLWAFNPGLLRLADGWLMAYRIVGGDGLRRIGLCRLSEDFQVVPSSRTPLSDLVTFTPGREVPRWFADPRLVRLGGRVFVHWNTGWQEAGNSQFLQELDVDAMIAVGPSRELRLVGPRRPIEKNWMLFGDGPFFAVYSVDPHRILTFSLQGDGDIACLDVAETPLAVPYAERFGELRGGAPPVRDGDGFVSVCHSVQAEEGGNVYRAAAYRFAASFPFEPTDLPSAPLGLTRGGMHRRRLPLLNPCNRHVVYPVGAAVDGDRWILSLGIEDERCAIVALSRGEVAATLQPVAA
jgi:predicted GH43/DUF377 family glycosyl hydrolase